IRAVVPRRFSFREGSALWSRRTFRAAIFPFRAAIINGVSPFNVRSLALAPASSSLPIIGALPFSAASHRGVAPSRFACFTSAPVAIRIFAISRSLRYAAHWIAVVPSAWAALTSAFCCTSMRRAALSPFIAASATALLLTPALLTLTKYAQKTTPAAARRVEFIQEVIIGCTSGWLPGCPSSNRRRIAIVCDRHKQAIFATCETGYRVLKRLPRGAAPFKHLPAQAGRMGCD